MTSSLHLAVGLLSLGGALLPLAAARAASPQDAPGATATRPADPVPDLRPQLIPERELEMHYYRARGSDARELSQVLMQMWGRMFHVQADDGASTPPISNVRTFGDVVVLYDRPERIETMVRILAELEEADSWDAPSVEPLVVAEYRPQYLATKALAEALAPFRRQIHQPQGAGARGPQGGGWVWNVSVLDQPATIVMRDTAEHVAEMLALMDRLDVAPPQVELTCWLLTGADADSATDLPKELTDNLSRIVPEDHFRRLCTAMIRTSVRSDRVQMLQSDYATDEFTESFELLLEPAGFDPDAGALPLTRCRFQATTGQQFETSVTLRSGEYTVLGAAGSEPLFVVLQVTALDA